MSGKHIGIHVQVFDLADDKQVRERKGNYNDPDFRAWLDRITYWALTNNCAIEYAAINSKDKPA